MKVLIICRLSMICKVFVYIMMKWNAVWSNVLIYWKLLTLWCFLFKNVIEWKWTICFDYQVQFGRDGRISWSKRLRVEMGRKIRGQRFCSSYLSVGLSKMMRFCVWWICVLTKLIVWVRYGFEILLMNKDNWVYGILRYCIDNVVCLMNVNCLVVLRWL